MVHTVHSSLLQYPLGVVFTSKQPRMFGKYYSPEEVTVGNEFAYNEPLEKYIVFESYGPVELKHVFLRFVHKEKRSLYPVYTRVLSKHSDDKNGARVVLYRQSIQALLSAMKKTTVEIKSTNDIILNQMIDNFTALDAGRTADMLEEFKEQEYDRSLVNNSTVLLPFTRSSIVDEGIGDLGLGSVAYLSGSMSIDGSMDKARHWTSRLESYIYDLSCSPIATGEFSLCNGPLWAELEAIFNPDMGETYEEMKFDPVTRTNKTEVVVDPKQLTSVMCGGRPRAFQFPLQVEKPTQVIYPTEFNSNLLLWTTAIHQLPFREISFTYILPIRERPYSFQNVKGSVLGMFPFQQALLDLVDVSFLWKNTIDKVDVLITASDECWMTLYEGNTTKTVFIDLTIPALLSQKFYS